MVFSTGDMDLVVAKHAVRKLGEITAKLEDAERAPVFAQLLGMLEGNRTHVLNTAIVAIAEMLRKSPTVVGDVITELQARPALRGSWDAFQGPSQTRTRQCAC